MKVLCLLVALVMFSADAFSREKELLINKLVYDEGPAFCWFRRDCQRDFEAVYGEEQIVQDVVWAVIDKYEDQIQQRLAMFYNQTFNRNDILMLVAPVGLARKDVVRKLYESRDTSNVIRSDMSFFSKIATEVSNVLDLYQW